MSSRINPSPAVPWITTVKGGVQFAAVNGNPKYPYQWDKNNLQPRAGFTYMLNERTILRGGYGLYFLNVTGTTTQNGFSISTPLITSNDFSPVADHNAAQTETLAARESTELMFRCCAYQCDRRRSPSTTRCRTALNVVARCQPFRARDRSPDACLSLGPPSRRANALIHRPGGAEQAPVGRHRSRQLDAGERPGRTAKDDQRNS